MNTFYKCRSPSNKSADHKHKKKIIGFFKRKKYKNKIIGDKVFPKKK